VIGLGGVGDGRPQIDRPVDAPMLRIEGWVMFGGFGVASEGPRIATTGPPLLNPSSLLDREVTRCSSIEQDNH
jgi:hypothetical protein